MGKARQKSLNIERILGLSALILIALSWYIGGLRSRADVLPTMKQLVPHARQFQILEGDMYAVWADEKGRRLLGYIKISQAMGYGGPMTIAVSTDPDAKITGIGILDHKDTPTYFTRILEDGFIKSILGKSYQNDLLLDQDIDGVSGATKSSQAMVESVRNAVRAIAVSQLGIDIPAENNQKIKFALPEIILLLLFTLGIFARSKNVKRKSSLRWVSLLTGLVCLGFVYDNPLTISMVNQLLLGFWPQWHTSLYLYLLVGGILILFIVEGKNPYCRWICPFGAAQDCIGKITNARSRSIGSFRGFLKWTHRFITLLAILVALYYRSPGFTGYEVFGALFKMWGSAFQFIVIALVFFMSLYTIRPWCNFLCPIRPVDDYFRMMRKWIKEI